MATVAAAKPRRDLFLLRPATPVLCVVARRSRHGTCRRPNRLVGRHSRNHGGGYGRHRRFVAARRAASACAPFRNPAAAVDRRSVHRICSRRAADYGAFYGERDVAALCPGKIRAGQTDPRARRCRPFRPRLYGRGGAGRPRRRTRRAIPGGAGAWARLLADDGSCRATAGVAGHLAEYRQYLYRSVQGHDAGFCRRYFRFSRHGRNGARRSPVGRAEYHDHGLRLRRRILFRLLLWHVPLRLWSGAPFSSFAGRREEALMQAPEHKTPENQAAIEIAGLNKWYGEFHVLRDIDLTVRRGERIVICGPSGSGKSTLLRCVNRLEDWQRGSIVVDGVELSEDRKGILAGRRDVGGVFQQFNLFPHLTVLENCTLAPIWVRRMPKRDAEELAMRYLARVKIPEQAQKYPARLSGGQQQRVAIARALCMSPNIMLFDEPTSALDPEMVKEVLDTMAELATDGITMLVVSHEMGFARQVADRVILMDDGQIVEINAPGEFFDRPQHERARLFLQQILH